MQSRINIESNLSLLGKSVTVFLSVFLFFNINISIAQQFSASAPKSIPENQNFNLSFTLENAQGNNLQLPPINDFTITGGPSTSTSMQIMNGSMTQSQTYTYTLRPKKQGTFKIGKASISVNGATLYSNELTVTVTAPSSKPQRQQRQYDPFDPFGQMEQNDEPQTSSSDIEKQIKGDVFVKCVLNKSSVYKGEMLTATFKLYFRQNIAGYNLSKSPQMDGFWSKEVTLDPNRRQTVENINGKQFYTVDILKYNLFPQRTGTLQVSPAELSVTVQVTTSRSNDPFGGFFSFGQTQNIPLTIKTNPVTVTVKELPANDKPKGFAGAVGKFNYSTFLSGKEAKTDNPVTYTIKISGTGNLSLIDAPTIQLPDGFEVYDPKAKENIANTAAGVSGSKQYDYLIIPRQPGEFKISGQPFSYFDPETGRYTTINTPEYSLKVTGEPSKSFNSASSSSANQQDISLLYEDIRYIKTTTPEFRKSDNSFMGSGGFIALYALPFLAFIGLIAVRRRNEKLASDIIGTKRRRALKLSKKRLSVAEKYMAQSERKKFYDEVSRAIWGYLGDKLNIDMAKLSKDIVTEKLSVRNVQAETVTSLFNIINSCEISLYTPGSDSEMKNDYTTALNLIADLEDEISK